MSSHHTTDMKELTAADRETLSDLVKVRLAMLDTRARRGYWESSSNEYEYKALLSILGKLEEN